MMQAGGGRLPSEYQEVEYLNGGGTAYILFDFLSTYINPVFYVDYYAHTQSGGVFGSTDYVQLYNYGILQGHQSSFAVRLGSGTAYVNTGFTPANDNIISEQGERAIVEIFVRTKLAKVNGQQLVWYNTPSTPTIPNKIPLFIRYWGGSYDAGYGGDIYEFCVKDENGDYYAQLIPCYRKADNVAGMYDLVNDVFYINAGSGSFIIGPDV